MLQKYLPVYFSNTVTHKVTLYSICLNRVHIELVLVFGNLQSGFFSLVSKGMEKILTMEME